MSSQYERETKISQLNWLIIILVCGLGALGVAMLYSAANGDWSPWANRQGTRLIIGLGVMIAVALTPSRALLKYAYWIYILCVLGLVAVEVIGHMGMGAQRWVSVGGMSLQPSEIMKLAVILALARYYHGLLPEDVSRPLMLIPPLLLIGIPAALILKQPNLGTATITTAIGIIMIFSAGAYWRYFITVGVAGGVSIPVLYQFLHDYQKQRVKTFLDPESDPLGAGYNIMQSKIAIGSGGLFGRGFMQGSQSQLDFLPEKHTDFIFTMIAEEWGFVGATAVICTYLLLITLALATASRSRSRFGAMLAVGIAALLMMHMMINMGMVMGLLPVVGVPLPLLSYGGTMQIAMMIGFGLLLNSYVHRDVQLRKTTISALG